MVDRRRFIANLQRNPFHERNHNEHRQKDRKRKKRREQQQQQRKGRVERRTRLLHHRIRLWCSCNPFRTFNEMDTAKDSLVCSMRYWQILPSERLKCLSYERYQLPFFSRRFCHGFFLFSIFAWHVKEPIYTKEKFELSGHGEFLLGSKFFPFIEIARNVESGNHVEQLNIGE